MTALRVVGIGPNNYATAFLMRLLKPNPRYRPTAEEAIRHPWLGDIVETTLDDGTAVKTFYPRCRDN